MMKSNRKKVTAMCMAVLFGVSLIGCGTNSKTDNNSSNITSKENEQEVANENTVVVQVQSIDGYDIVALKGEMKEMDDMGTRPDRSSETDQDASEQPEDNKQTTTEQQESDEQTTTEQTEQQEGDDNQAPPDLPEGENQTPPDGSGDGRGKPTMFESSGETITFTIPEDAKITVKERGESKEGSIEDIKEQTVLELTYDSDNNISNILVKNIGGMSKTK